MRFIDQHLAKKRYNREFLFLEEAFGCIYTWFICFTAQCFHHLCEQNKEDLCVSDVEGLLDGGDDVFDLRQAVVLQDLSVRHRDVDARHPGGRSVQEVEGRT